jgi:hypothetical protein
MRNFWQVWLHRTDHWGLAWATGMCLGIGIATGAWWLVLVWVLFAAWDMDRTRRRQLELRAVAEKFAPPRPMNTWPEGQDEKADRP